MSQAKKCDICGKLYDEYTISAKDNFPNIKRKGINALMLVNLDCNDEYYKNTVYDCCKECMTSLLRHIKELKGEV